MPEIKVEIAFDSGFATPMADRTYTDVSEFVEAQNAVSISHGRSDELSSPSPGSCSLTLDNSGGDFTPGKASSAFYPNVRKGKPLRTQVRYDGIWYARYTGYVEDYALTWPDGSDAVATTQVSCMTRRSRLGNMAPLTSAIRAAYLSTSPQAYWPLSDDFQNTDGRRLFRDITNTPVAGRATQSLFGFYDDIAIAPRINDGTPGPTDEGGMVFFPKTTSGAWGRYVGGGGVMSINSAEEFTVEMLARLSPSPPPVGEAVWVVLFSVSSANLRQEAVVYLYDNTMNGEAFPYVGVIMITRDDVGAIVEMSAPYGVDEGAYFRATDGELHHFAVILQFGFICTLYMDGVEVASTYLGSSSFTDRFTGLGIGNRGEHGTMWAGHAAAHDRALTPDEIGERAAAATAASETPEERVVRVAGRAGVPADEIVVEDSVARDLGSQPEAGRSAAAVIDEVANSTGGVLYDARDGTLAMQARNHRYNAPVEFTLSGTLQEIQGDLTTVDDHRYTINTVEYTRAGVDGAVPTTVVDQDSIDEYGVFNPGSFDVISESDTEVEAFATNLLYRYAHTGPRVSTVTVDVLNLDPDQRALVLAADIGTRFALVDLTQQVPEDPMYLFVEGYSETLTATSHTITFNTTPADLFQNVFTLDDPVLGQLDAGNVIAY